MTSTLELAKLEAQFKDNGSDEDAKDNFMDALNSTAMDDNLSLSEKIKERYRSMYVGVFFKRYILGLWCVAEGLVYSMFDEEKHVTDEHMSGALEYIVSIDYGTANPFSAGLWAFDGKNSQREAELYYNSREVAFT